jgi:flagellar assembly protein FliH
MAKSALSSSNREPLSGWMWEELSPSNPRGARPADKDSVPEITLEEELEIAFQQGLERGEQKGLEKARREMKSVLVTVEKAAEQLAGIRKQWTSALEQNVSALALVVARLLVDREMEVSPEILSGLLKKALAHFPPNQSVRIRVNPADLAILTSPSDVGKGRPAPGEEREVRWISDATVGRGGCVVEGPDRIVDGRIEAALERVYRKVNDA